MRSCDPLRDFQKMCQVLLTISVFGTCFSCRFKIAPKSGKSIRACVTSVLYCRDRHGENDKQIGLLLGRNLRIGKGEPIKYTLSF